MERKNSIGSRLEEERKRLNKTQEQFAPEIPRQTQSKYESDKTHPNSLYLAAIASAGADVLYILTGVRSANPASPDEYALLDAYRAADEAGRAALLATARVMAKKG